MTPEEILLPQYLLDAEAQVPDALEQAAEYISEHGWIQGQLEEDGKVCAIGAINKVCPGNSLVRDLAGERASRYLRDTGTHEHGIIAYNDMTGRSAEDVILALKGAAHQ